MRVSRARLARTKQNGVRLAKARVRAPRKNRDYSNISRLSILTLTTVLLWSTGKFASAQADDFSIIDVKRNIQMSENEPVSRDYYISAGSSQGLKINMVLPVFRRVPVRDPSGGQTLGDLQVPVGQLKVLFLQDRLAIAREFQLSDPELAPVLDQKGVMIGDRVQLNGAFIDKKKQVVKRTTASEDVPHAKEKSESQSLNEENPASSTSFKAETQKEAKADLSQKSDGGQKTGQADGQEISHEIKRETSKETTQKTSQETSYENKEPTAKGSEKNQAPSIETRKG